MRGGYWNRVSHRPRFLGTEVERRSTLIKSCLQCYNYGPPLVSHNQVLNVPLHKQDPKENKKKEFGCLIMRKVGVVGASRGTRVFRHLSLIFSPKVETTRSLYHPLYIKLDMTIETVHDENLRSKFPLQLSRLTPTAKRIR